MKPRIVVTILIVLFATLAASASISMAQEDPPPLSPDGDIPAGRAQPRPVRVTAPSSAQAAITALTEYLLPIPPYNLLYAQDGDMWFSSFSGNAVGRLDISAGQVLTYARQGVGSVWGLKQDAQGDIWFTTANTTVVGRFEPDTGTFTEWGATRNHFGLELDAATGGVWFTTKGDNGIWRLSPATNSATAWLTMPYTDTYDLDIDPGGYIWFTVQLLNQAVVRLDPDNDLVTVWTTPISTGRPLRVFAETSDSIWFTQYDPSANSIAHPVPSTNVLSEFTVPTANSNPHSLLRYNGYTWFTESGAGKVGQLDPANVVPTVTVLSPSTFTATKANFDVPPISYAVTASITPTLVTETMLAPVVTGGFVELTLPRPVARLMGWRWLMGGSGLQSEA